MNEPKDPINEIHQALTVLFRPGDVVELRVPKCGAAGTISGYFDDQEKLAAGIAELSGGQISDRIVPGVYITLNPVAAGAGNKVTNSWAGNAAVTTRDSDIAYRRWLLIDIDPSRPSNVSASNREKKAAGEVAKKVMVHLRGLGWPEPVVADSGNGVHLLYRIDLPSDANATTLIKACLAALAQRFDTNAASVDRTVYNAARIVKAYGSLACKGENTVERPHRCSRLLHVPSRIRVVDRSLLEKLTAMASSNDKEEEAPIGVGPRAQITPDKVEQFLKSHKIAHGPQTEYQDGYRWALKRCPWENEHTSGRSAGEVAVFWFADKLVFKCQHSHCAERGWKEFRAYLEAKNGARYRFTSGGETPTATNDPSEVGSLQSVRDRIEELLYASRTDRDDLPPVKQAPAAVTDLIWNDLNHRGSFFTDDDAWQAYLHLPNPEPCLNSLPSVVRVGPDPWFHSLLDRFYGIHAADPLSHRVVTQLGIRALSERAPAPVHELGHYNEASGELYVCLGGVIIAIRGDSFRLIQNGFNGFHFVPNRLASPIDAAGLIQLASEMSGTFGLRLCESPLADFLFARTPFDPTSPVRPEQAKQLILAGFLSLPFGDFFAEKPIFYLTGDEDSGKTATLRKMGLLLYGLRYDVTSLGDEVRDFTTALVSKYYLPIDDVSTNGSRARASANAKRLTQAATNGTVFQRRLYTNADPVELRFKAWPWISGLSVFDRAPDFLSRLLNINFRGCILGERQGPSQVKRFLEKNRILLLAEYLVRVQAVVRAAADPQLSEKKYGIRFRISDWAGFLARAADAEGWLDSYRDLFESQRAARLAEISTDSLLIPLKLWLVERGNMGRKMEVSALYNELRRIVEGTTCTGLTVPCLNGASASVAFLATHLRTLAKTILEPEYGFVETASGWDSNRNRIRTMSFSPTEDQLASIVRWRDGWVGGSQQASPDVVDVV